MKVKLYIGLFCRLASGSINPTFYYIISYHLLILPCKHYHFLPYLSHKPFYLGFELELVTWLTLPNCILLNWRLLGHIIGKEPLHWKPVGHFTGKATSLEMPSKLEIHFTGRCDFTGNFIHTYIYCGRNRIVLVLDH